MKTSTFLGAFAGISILVAGCNRSSNSGASADEQNTNSGVGRDTSATAPDNTARNTHDRADSTLTPADQGGSEADRETTRRIRRAIMSDGQLSTDAKNIKITTINGKVTLRGPVATAEEATRIASKVQQLGITSFDNQLEAKTEKQ